VRVAVGEAGRTADATLGDQRLDPEEARERAAVIGDEERHAGRRERLVHAVALGVAARHRLLDVGGLAGRGDGERELQVRARRGRDVDGVDIWISDELLRALEPAGNAVTAGIVLGEVRRAPHHGDQGAPLGPGQRGAALDLGHVPAAQDSPADQVFHRGAKDATGGDASLYLHSSG